MKLSFIPCAVIITIITGCAQPKPQSTATSTEPTFGTWVFAKEKAGAEDIRKKYLDGAIKLANSAGMRESQGFSAQKNLMGELTPEFIGLFTWPNAEAANTTRSSDIYVNEYRPLRPKGWDQMVAVDVHLPSVPTWQFEPERYYTVALVWTKSDEAYQHYLQSTARLRETMDFSIVYSAPVVAWSQLGLAPSLRAPDRISLLSWPDENVPNRYLEALGTEELSAIADATFEGISWHQIEPYH